MQPVLLGGAFTLIGIFVGHLLSRSRDTAEVAREHARWTRDRRLDAYIELLTAAIQLGPAGLALGLSTDSPADKAKEHQRVVNRVYEAHARVAVLGPSEVRQAGAALLDTAMKLLSAGVHNNHAQWDTINAQMQEVELGFVTVAREAAGVDLRPS